MTATKKPRATILLEWTGDGHRGILVHADRYKNTWILPGGGIEAYKKDGKPELPIAAAIRELFEETGLTATEVKFLFTHEGGHYQHHVFEVRAEGRLDKIKDSKEAPAFAVCGPDLTPHPFLWEDGYATDNLKLSYSTKDILKRHLKLSAPKGVTPTSVTASAVATPAPKAAASPAVEPPGPHIIADDPGVFLRVAVGTSILELTGGDIVKQDVDAVVNAANRYLADGAGVAGAIFKAAGRSELDAACKPYGGCPVGEARITPGFRLKARQIIHAVGPKFGDYTPEKADQLLAGAYRCSLELVTKHKLQSIGFPSISTGIFGFPPERAAPLALKTVLDHLRDHQEIALVRFVLWPENMAIYGKALKRLLGA